MVLSLHIRDSGKQAPDTKRAKLILLGLHSSAASEGPEEAYQVVVQI